MALTQHNRSRLTIGLTFLAAFVLSVLPGPQWAEPFRPDWVGLTLIYWCMAVPQRVGVGTGWTVGLILDVLYGSLLGQQALAKTLLAFLTIKLHLQLRMFPRWQQAVSVFVLIALNYLLLIWIKSLVGQTPIKWNYWTSGIVSMLIWPWLFIILRDIRRRAHVS
ncbi:MAG TPA: rod shape-determining protein MreD [Acidiferrobacterales bacterium]|jgi:rod shape-determining protein MreD